MNKLNFLNTVQPANKAEANVLNQGKALMQRIIDAPLLTNRDCDDFLIQFYDFEEFFNSIDALSSVDQFVVSDSAEVSLSEPMDTKNTELTANSLANPSEPESTPTVEELVEMMEENEDTVECKWCNELFDKSECRKEVDLGWLCSSCEAAIKSRGETLTFIENDYGDFLDEKLDIDFSKCIDSSDMEIWGVEPIGENTYKAVLLKRYENVPFRGNNYPDEIARIESEMFDLGGLFVFHFGKDGLPCLGRWDPELLNSMGTCEIIFDDTSYDYACEKALNNVTVKTEALEVTHDLGNEYDGAYPDYKPELSKVDETPDVSNSPLRLCPECGKDTFDIETGICIECGSNFNLTEELDPDVTKRFDALDKKLESEFDALYKDLDKRITTESDSIQDWVKLETDYAIKAANSAADEAAAGRDDLSAASKALAKNDQIIYNAIK